MLKRLHAVLEQAAAGRGQSAEALLDHLLPDHGLDPAGRLAVSAGGMHAVIGLDDRHGAILDGPDAGALAKVKEVAELLEEVRGTVSAARELELKLAWVTWCWPDPALRGRLAARLRRAALADLG